VKRLLALCGIAASLAVAAAADIGSARPPALLTYSVVYGPGHAGGPGGGLCLARTDGSRRRRLTRRNVDRAASWSPNGRFVVFTRGRATGRILVANTRGRVVRELKPAGTYSDPAWSPNGSKIAYVSQERGWHIVVATATTGRVVAQTPPRVALLSRPAWSPDSSKIAYAEQVDIDASRQSGSSRIVVVNADGAGGRTLVGQASDPAWSPDGSKIAYISYPSRFAESGDVAVANADGSDARNLTATPEHESRPAWSPNGRVIAFARGSDSASAILSVPSGGGAERVLVRSRAYGAADPAWRRPVVLAKARRPVCS
jgi:Tol biopolymer transport system component